MDSSRSRLARLLSGGAFVRAVGKRAYSLYLVHWPIVILYNLHAGPSRSPFILLGLLISCIIAAELLYRGVEGPMRLRITSTEAQARRSGAMLFLILIAAIASTAYISSSSHRLVYVGATDAVVNSASSDRKRTRLNSSH